MPKINISGNEEEKIYTDELIISKNVFIYDTSFIPLYNISMVSITEEPKETYHIWACIIFAIGIAIEFIVFARFTETGTNLEIVTWFVIGFILVSIGLFDICITNQKNSEAGEYMVINLNSGRSVFFYSRSHAFIMKVMDVIINCINNGDECIINLEHCNIKACQFGDGNIMSGR